MRRARLACSWLLAVPAAFAQDGDALHAAACRQALSMLQAREAAVADAPAGTPAHQAALAQLQAAREHAARLCLQSRADRPALPGRLAQPPMAVPPPLAATPQLAPLPPPPAGLPVPLPAPALPKSITSCDALGCWASDGTRLQRVGPNLLGPRGFCSAPGGVLQCPP
jgi:hypothetical protein